MTTLEPELRPARRRTLERIRTATANLEAAKRQAKLEPDNPAAHAWLESAAREALDVQAIGMELGMDEE